MPSPQANQLTRRHKAELALLGAAVTRRILALSRTADPKDIDAWWQRVGPTALRLVSAGYSAAARLAALYLRRHAEIESRLVVPTLAVVSAAQIETSLRVTGPVRFKQVLSLSGSDVAALRSMRESLEGSTSRLVLNGGRETVLETFKQSDQIKGWRRIGDDSPCFFCAMLISRGAVYSENTVEFRAHDKCGCAVEPLYQREQEPEDVLELRKLWDETTAGLSGKNAVNAFRKEYEGPAPVAD